MVKFKNIILFSPEWRVRRWQEKRKTISNNGNLDPRVADGILAGENDFKISSLDKIAGALNLIYVMIPIPKSPSIICSIRQYAHNTKLYWMISKKKAAEALSHFFSAASFLETTREVYDTIYELNRVASGCIRGGNKDQDLVIILRKCINEMQEYRDVVKEKEKNKEATQ